MEELYLQLEKFVHLVQIVDIDPNYEKDKNIQRSIDLFNGEATTHNIQEFLRIMNEIEKR